MKSVIALTILLGALVAVSYAGHEEMSEEKMKLFTDCKEQEKATDEDIESYKKMVVPQTPTGKCLMACVHEKTGAIKDGKVDAAALKARITKMREHLGERASAVPIDDIVDQCHSVSNPDRCELGFQLVECIHKTLKDHKKN